MFEQINGPLSREARRAASIARSITVQCAPAMLQDTRVVLKAAGFSVVTGESEMPTTGRRALIVLDESRTSDYDVHTLTDLLDLYVVETFWSGEESCD